MQELGFVRQSPDLIPGASALDNAALKLLGKPAGVREARRRVEPSARAGTALANGSAIVQSSSRWESASV